MSKIRVLHKAPVLNDLGVILSVVELAGPSSESKPTTGFANGSLFLETDTGKIYIFDEDDGWKEAGGGGGGGGSQSNILIIPFSYIEVGSEDDYYELDASYNDIVAAHTAGKIIFACGEGVQLTLCNFDEEYGLNKYYASFCGSVNTINNYTYGWIFSANDTTSKLRSGGPWASVGE